jgi:hypothetical protein
MFIHVLLTLLIIKKKKKTLYFLVIILKLRGKNILAMFHILLGVKFYAQCTVQMYMGCRMYMKESSHSRAASNKMKMKNKLKPNKVFWLI